MGNENLGKENQATESTGGDDVADLDWVERVYGIEIREACQSLMAIEENRLISVHKLARIAVDEYWSTHSNEIGALLDVPFSSE